MAKIKNRAKKNNLSDRIVKSDPKKKILNPFEVHVNRQKYDVLGRKTKNDKGLPGVSRAKALVKRKKTLLQEYRIKDKSNKFLDRRIGERNHAMTAEDRIMARFTAERMKMHNKKSIFNLGDDEVLTHHGQTLSEIEKFDDPRSDDEEEDRGKLDAEFVEDAHFGGGILKKTSNEGHTSRKDLIEQLIAESKKRKAEKQRTREQTIELTEKLDTEWKDLLPIVSASKRDMTEDDGKPDSYDTVMRQLKFEARGKPSDRLKSEEEIAREDKEKLEELEAERLKRMHGFKEDSVPERKHRSADDLDDGFQMESDDEVMLTYDAEGNLDVQLDKNDQLEVDIGQGVKENEENKENNSLSDTPENSDDSNNDDNDNNEIESDDNEGDGDNNEDDSDGDDSLSDLKNLSHSEDEDADCRDSDVQNESATQAEADNRTFVKNSLEDKDEIKADLLARKKVMELARKELPYTFQVSETYEDLQAVLCGQSPDHQAVILERMIKCNHPSLGEGYKDKLANLFAFLLQHLQDTAVSSKDKDINCFIVLDRLVPHLYDLAHVSPENAGHCISEVLKEKQQDYRARRKTFPGLDTLVFLKLISHLFPTSDFRHPIVTPTLVFMSQMLTQCRLKNVQDVAVGLFLVTLILEYTVLSKRFAPSTICFLHGIIEMAVPKKCLRLVSVVYPVHITASARNLLVLSESSVHRYIKFQSLTINDLQGTTTEDNTFKLRSLHTAVKLLLEFCNHLGKGSASYSIFKPVLIKLQELDLDSYPGCVVEDIKNLMSRIENMAQQKLQLLIVEKKKPKPLRLYEPKIEQVFDGRKRRPMSKERQEHEKLLHKYKREMKGAIREIRRDKTFLAKLKLKQSLKNDMERQQKVREIYGSAALQQGELRKLKRKKR